MCKLVFANVLLIEEAVLDFGTNLQTYAIQIDPVLAAVPAAWHPSQVQEGRRRLDAQRHPQEVQREAVEAALLEGGMLQGVAAKRVLLTTPQPQGTTKAHSDWTRQSLDSSLQSLLLRRLSHVKLES